MALSKSAPWKPPGEDGAPTFTYKVFPAAKTYLTEHIQQVLTGTKKFSEKDVRARLLLIHKKGDDTDPNNYRPISLLNTDYKLTTAVVTAILKESLPDWMIPPQQLVRDGYWGTTHGLLEDKSLSTVARVRRTKNYSTWFDFGKAYDSINHKCLKRLL